MVFLTDPNLSKIYSTSGITKGIILSITLSDIQRWLPRRTPMQWDCPDSNYSTDILVEKEIAAPCYSIEQGEMWRFWRGVGGSKADSPRIRKIWIDRWRGRSGHSRWGQQGIPLKKLGKNWHIRWESWLWVPSWISSRKYCMGSMIG